MACLKYPLRRMMVAGALLVLCVNALFVSAASTTDYTADQQKNTLAFLKGFAIAGSTLETSWTGTDFCSWPYVRCGYLASTLSFKAYSRPAFTGSLVLPELGADVNGSAVIFTEISASWFGQQVTGTLPTSWGRLRKLRTLRLNYNSLNGPLPADWSGMSALQSLYLNSNRLEGSLPGQWRLLSELKDLRLDNNSLSGALPAAWIRMSSLKDLYLNSNALSGTLPAAWVALTALWSLDLSNNQLTGSIPERWGELRVYTLELSSNRLCGCVPTKLKNGSYPPTVDPAVSAANCTTANVCEAHSSGSASAADDSEEIAMLTANEQNTLKFLRLVRAAVGGELRSLWGGVWYCGWQNVKCGSSGLASVTLNDVTLSGSVQLPELTSDIDGSLVDVTSFELHGKGASVTGALPTSWGRLARLQTVRVQSNAITGTLPSAWSEMTSLRSLNVSGNALSGGVPDSWGGMTKLVSVDLKGTGLCGCLPEGWKSKTVAADAALTARDCASANACPAASSTSAPPKKTGWILIPLWCVLGAVGGLLVGLAVSFGVRFYRRRQRAREVSRFQAVQEAEMQPFSKMPDSQY
ncbi:unspecified product [Leptomonas pyrrhocoris]|uniref:Unspecified product n=1 Tax=Leptomonas pyrrhocoris TaxID=157538 RepID=A0A0N0DYI5_LEPPY|nr:unspecified product [Leptomonas pyrrhocoris]KPA84172.1 unspecified product [Leptomonas pyrrhocoris]|eukprot:XP_015662611.1 unspecified product [Leptomonas pyrrhocoris]